MNDGGLRGNVSIGIDDLVKCVREIDPALPEPDGADRNDAVPFSRVQSRGLGIEGHKIGL